MVPNRAKYHILINQKFTLSVLDIQFSKLHQNLVQYVIKSSGEYAEFVKTLQQRDFKPTVPAG